jgi:hypothetical protein
MSLYYIVLVLNKNYLIYFLNEKYFKNNKLRELFPLYLGLLHCSTEIINIG